MRKIQLPIIQPVNARALRSSSSVCHGCERDRFNRRLHTLGHPLPPLTHLACFVLTTLILTKPRHSGHCHRSLLAQASQRTSQCHPRRRDRKHIGRRRNRLGVGRVIHRRFGRETKAQRLHSLPSPLPALTVHFHDLWIWGRDNRPVCPTRCATAC